MAKGQVSGAGMYTLLKRDPYDKVGPWYIYAVWLA